MAHVFLSDDWFDAGAAVGSPRSGPFSGAVNMIVTRSDADDVAIHLEDGAMGRGLAPGVPTTVTTTFDVAKALLVDGDQHVARNVFMSGLVQVEGDMTKLMAMGTVTPTREQRAYLSSIRGPTAQ